MDVDVGVDVDVMLSRSRPTLRGSGGVDDAIMMMYIQ